MVTQYWLQSSSVAPLFRNKLKSSLTQLLLARVTTWTERLIKRKAIYRYVHRGTWIFIPSIPVSDDGILSVQADKKEDTLNTNHNLDTNVVWKGEGL